jgi:hypothetical protein
MSVTCTTQTHDAQEFVVKTTKKESSSVLKEQSCTCITQALTLTPVAIADSAHTQTQLMDMCSAIIEGDFFNATSKDQISVCAQHAHKILNLQERINELIQEQKETVHALHNMQHVKPTQR